MTTHNFHYKRSLMRVSCANYSIDTFDNTMQRGIGTNRHIRTAEIIINGTY